jgi:hypothetical protein
MYLWRKDMRHALRLKITGTAGALFFTVIGLNAQDQTVASRSQQVAPEVSTEKSYEVMAEIYAAHLKALPDYQIQLGFGTLEQANEIIGQFQAIREADSLFYPTKELKLTFESPTYRVRLQFFADRIEAEKAFADLRTLFPSSILLKPGSRTIN